MFGWRKRRSEDAPDSSTGGRDSNRGSRNLPLNRLKIDTREIREAIVLDLSGHLVTGEESWSLSERVREVVSQSESPRIVLNMRHVVFIDSSGVAELVASLTVAKKSNGMLNLAEVTGQVRDILQLTKVVTIFDVHDSVEEAAANFGGAAAGQGDGS